MHKKRLQTMRWLKHLRAQPRKKQLQAMCRVKHLRAQPPKKRVQAMWRGEHASNAVVWASASTTARGGAARNVGSRKTSPNRTEDLDLLDRILRYTHSCINIKVACDIWNKHIIPTTDHTLTLLYCFPTSSFRFLVTAFYATKSHYFY